MNEDGLQHITSKKQRPAHQTNGVPAGAYDMDLPPAQFQQHQEREENSHENGDHELSRRYGRVYDEAFVDGFIHVLENREASVNSPEPNDHSQTPSIRRIPPSRNSVDSTFLLLDDVSELSLDGDEPLHFHARADIRPSAEPPPPYHADVRSPVYFPARRRKHSSRSASKRSSSPGSRSSPPVFMARYERECTVCLRVLGEVVDEGNEGDGKGDARCERHRVGRGMEESCCVS